MDLRRGTLRGAMILLAILVGGFGLISCGDDSSPTGNTPVNRDPVVPSIDGAAGPAHGATDVPLAVVLQWSCDDPDGDALTYGVRFGAADPPPVVVADQAATQYAPSGLAHGTTYYWQIVAKDDQDATTASPVWNFTTVAAGAETVSVPAAPTGPTTGTTGESLNFATLGATSSEGHALEYRFSWNDTNFTNWSTSKSASMSWESAGTYTIKAHARCAEHPTLTSIASSGLTVNIDAPESVGTPGAAQGPTTGETSEPLDFTTTGSVSSLGHTVEYQFDWGDGGTSGWSTSGSRQHTWTAAGTYAITVVARCQEHPDVVSDPSSATEITIGAPAEVVYAPLMGPDSPTNGGAGEEIEFSAWTGGSSLGHEVEFRFDWGDGSYSDWGPKVGSYYTRTHAWSSDGTYEVRAQNRCVEHPNVASDWSAAVSVEIVSVETVSPPNMGLTDGRTWDVGDYADFLLYGAESSFGHPIEMQVDWGNGTMTDWSTSGRPRVPTDEPADLYVRARARCQDHPEIVSDWTATVTVHVVELEDITRPSVTGPVAGTVGVPVQFGATGAESSQGHALEYQLYYGYDYNIQANPQGWTTLDNLSITWDTPGVWFVFVKARCIDHPEVESTFSAYHGITISD